ncbi:MAG TPA: hypothetical protein VGR32_10150 [Brevundimonas sp.]|jgi:hypothetical protein|uniref:hypothetical protein n=1 Tax=Brevundimonas sp. TaxID=1871086 RepID=UPI002DF3981D|nr:hypothetical protein [Brevundimonas sp.]
MNQDELAAAFLERMASVWERHRLPLSSLAVACVTWGLQKASAEASPAEVAEGLQRIADTILESGDLRPRHLI